ncbi:type VI secretion system tip protein TssI/VgrG [Polyangium sp. 15x6]|uniref:type VI secretion system Vgr family protein n=1 Tax=Polyangium sp. 15x6 TaxID=3042687 RepID=UPI002499B8C1|nr:type VI secretion system tip protein TssI/VgrG [Polyangium sp. 15x6]MDI3290153.1 type VI secretion system tip protein TssI/VgrG [Polyangium sp. 15x6]
MPNDDFAFACEAIPGEGPFGAWGALRVVRFRGREALSEPYRYEITLLAKAGASDVDPRDLVGKRATLRIATLSNPPFKVVHGIVREASELADVPEGTLLRVILDPPWARAQHRTRCRIFLDKSLRRILEAVLAGDPLMEHRDAAEVEDDDSAPSFSPARELFTFRVTDTSRLDDPRARAFVVQYEESDFAFVSRLLEEEGISYHFENGRETCLLVLTDHDAGRPRLEPAQLGAAIPGRSVSNVALGARMRPTRVVLDDHDWRKPTLDIMAKAGSGDLAEYHYPGAYADAPGKGEPLASARLDRYHVEARYAAGAGSVRVLSAGSIFELEAEEPGHEGEYVVTRLDARGAQAGVLSQPAAEDAVPWEARFELARRGTGSAVEPSRFRPALRTPKPRIRGVQTALVTADPGASGAEVNVGGPDGLSVGCVRLRFPWDTEKARLAKEPSSLWVRVSQIFAGAGEGAVFHPRVGDEVIVDFDEGDPDRPVVVGRVYNGANLPARGAGHESSMKSLSTPGGGTYNEIMFGDAAGGEVLHYFAGKDQTTDVANFRRESVGSNAKMTVGGDNTETIAANRTENVGANDTLTIGGNQTITIGGNAVTIIGGNLAHSVGASELNMVGGSQTIGVGGSVTESVGADVSESYGASRETIVGGAVTESFGAMMKVSVGGNVTESAASHALDVSAARLMMIGGNYSTVVTGSVTTKVGAVEIEASGGPQTLEVGGSITRSGPLHLTFSAFEDDIKSAKLDAQGSSSSYNVITLEAIGMTRDVTGLAKSKSGASPSAYGFEKRMCGGILKIAAVGLFASGVDNQGGGPNVEA